MSNPYKLLFGPGLLVCSANPATYGRGDFNGPDSVQQAIDTMAAEGISGRILVLPGTYNPITVDVAECVVQGCGRSTLFSGAATSHAVTVSAADVVLQDFAVSTTAGGGNSYYGVYQNGARGRLQGLVCESSDRYGYHIGATGDDSIIAACRVVGSDGDAVYIDTNGENNVVGVNRLAGWTGEAIDDASGTSVTANLNEETA
jgi:hypothetical protein